MNKKIIVSIFVLFNIFVYDTLENNKIELANTVEGRFKLISFQDGKVVYEVGEGYNDKKTYTKFYTFDQDGKITIK